MIVRRSAVKADRRLAIDEPDGKDAKLFVDANGNGDLTDDPPINWEKHDLVNPSGKRQIQYTGDVKLPLGKDEKAPSVNLGTYRFDKNDKVRSLNRRTITNYISSSASEVPILLLSTNLR